MSRVKTIEGLTYSDLDRGLTQIGYVRVEQGREVIYRYPAEPDALILLPLFPLSSPVRAIDLLIVHKTIEGFGVADPHDFDLSLLGITGKPTALLAR